MRNLLICQIIQIQNHLSIKPIAQIRCSGCYVMAFRHNINQLKHKKNGSEWKFINSIIKKI